MSRYLELLVAEVQYEHSLRLDEADIIPKEQRPHWPRRRPNTALIAKACAANVARAEGHCWEPNCPRCAPA